LPACDDDSKGTALFINNSSSRTSCNSSGSTFSGCYCNGSAWVAADTGGGGSFDSEAETDLTWSDGLSTIINWIFDTDGNDDVHLFFADGAFNIFALPGEVDIALDGNFIASEVTGLITIAGSPTVAGELQFWDGAGELVSVVPPSNLVSWIWQLPPDNGALNQFLQTDGDGITIWADVSTHEQLVGGSGITVVGTNIHTSSTKNAFFQATGETLPCGAGNYGQMGQVAGDVMEYCDSEDPSIHHYIADADSTGKITDFSNAANMNDAGTVDDTHSGSDHADYLPLTGGTLTGPGDLVVDGATTFNGDVTVENLAMIQFLSAARFGGNFVIDRSFVFVDDDATPDVSAASGWDTFPNNVTPISDFDCEAQPGSTPATCYDGTMLYLIVGVGGQVFDCTGSGLECGGFDLAALENDALIWLRDDGNGWWRLVSHQNSNFLNQPVTCRRNITTEQANDILMCGKALTPLKLIKLSCVALGGDPTGYIVEVVECTDAGASCAGTGFTITAEDVETNYEDTDFSDQDIDIDNWWGIKINNLGTSKADYLNCQVEYRQL
jgi:hypothetical protein